MTKFITKHIVTIITITLILVVVNHANANTIVYCDHQGSIFFDPLIQNVYLGCVNDDGTVFELVRIEPSTAAEIGRFQIDGLLYSASMVDNGSNILLNLSTPNKLIKVDALTGAPVPGAEYPLDGPALAMEVDHQNNYAYVVWGIRQSKLAKFSTVDLQVIGNPISCGDLSDSIALTNDGSKLYIIDSGFRVDHTPIRRKYWVVRVFDTATMTELEPVDFDRFSPYTLVMGYDNRLFASNIVIDIYENYPVMWVVDTITDEIIHEVVLGDDTAIADLAIDPINQKLYGTAWPRVEYNETLDDYFPGPSSTIVWFDLEDHTYTPSYFELGTEKLWSIVVASASAYSRIFAISEESTNIYYMDLE